MLAAHVELARGSVKTLHRRWRHREALGAVPEPGAGIEPRAASSECRSCGPTGNFGYHKHRVLVVPHALPGRPGRACGCRKRSYEPSAESRFDSPAAMETLCGLASSRIGIVTVSTPFSWLALTLLVSSRSPSRTSRR